MLILETGNVFVQSEDLDHPANPWIVQALDLAGTHAINANLADLRRLRKMAEAGALPKDLRGRYLASMVEQDPAAPLPSEAYVVQSLPGGKGARIGVLAVNAPAGAGDPSIKTISAAEALGRYLPKVDEQSDLVVVLARMKDEDLAELARAFPSIDVIISGSTKGEGRELPRVGSTVLLESSHDGIALGTLQVEWDEKGRITSARNDFMPLVPMITDAPAMVSIVENARRAYSSRLEEKARSIPAPKASSIFAGARACIDCHEKAYGVWQKSGHARAIEPLKNSGNLYNDKCLPCHVTGFWVDRGFVNMVHTPQLANVQCEACHDASVDHAGNPQNVHPGTGPMQTRRWTVRRDFCLRCHTPENSPGFAYDTYWPKIKH